ncbi:DUF4012 domain-containing protein [Nocardioides sp. TRM66260-LWL]|uniref:DUF4012 domain-containing protein n=1 Tax=Nocardioides sp. TRM66260-LWL TaxID=2874478 RepID=UPI001CC3BF2F|nr:DUF4012 domain-containing protein [Nocardioides sp. TRM66260-LWL]MBZ5734717.1 DUF4012 domain-containing protein [Nocardioides sp. TRM66260-LWL]
MSDPHDPFDPSSPDAGERLDPVGDDRRADGEYVRVRVRRTNHAFLRARRRRRVLRLLIGAGAVVALVVGVLGYDGYRLYQSLHRTQAASAVVADALGAGDQSAAAQAGRIMADSATDAHRRSDHLWWRLAAHLPFVGTEITATRDLSAAADTLAGSSVRPLVDAAGVLPGLVRDGRLDVPTLRRLERPIVDLGTAADAAAAEVADVRTDELAGPGSGAIAGMIEQVRAASSALGAGGQTLRVLPAMLGGSGTRHYLLVVENNAEIRSTGGLPGSWALLTVRDGRIGLDGQGSAGDVGMDGPPVARLSAAERRLFTGLPATDFRDTAFTPDADRAARLQALLWERSQGTTVRPGEPPVRLDGVVQIDTVALSYLLRGVGPVRLLSGPTLTEDDAVATLLSRSYARLGGASDRLFREATEAAFQRLVTRPVSLLDVVTGLARAEREDRLRVVGLAPDLRRTLDRAGVTPDLLAADGPTALVTLDDNTGSKMSYYLRRGTTAQVTCEDGRRVLTGYTRLSQTITDVRARRLDPYVTGAGLYGVEPGQQRVAVRVYGPPGATLERVELDGAEVTDSIVRTRLDRRPVASLPVLLRGPRDVLVAWRFRLPAGFPQGADAVGQVWQTPSVVPGPGRVAIDDRCG